MGAVQGCKALLTAVPEQALCLERPGEKGEIKQDPPLWGCKEGQGFGRTLQWVKPVCMEQRDQFLNGDSYLAANYLNGHRLLRDSCYSLIEFALKCNLIFSVVVFHHHPLLPFSSTDPRTESFSQHSTVGTTQHLRCRETWWYPLALPLSRLLLWVPVSVHLRLKSLYVCDTFHYFSQRKGNRGGGLHVSQWVQFVIWKWVSLFSG